MTPTFDAISLVVEDMSRALAFYRALGCEVPAEADSDDHAEWTSAGGVRLLWDTRANVVSFSPDWTAPSGGPAMSLAFNCGSPAVVDETVAQLAKAGATVVNQPWDAFWGQRYATVLDPDGNHVDLYAPL